MMAILFFSLVSQILNISDFASNIAHSYFSNEYNNKQKGL